MIQPRAFAAAFLTMSLLTASACQTAVGNLKEAAPIADVDLLIAGGIIHDGSGSAPFPGSVAIDDGRVIAVIQGNESGFSAERTINATGLIVSPGFIDPHTHADSDLLAENAARRSNLPYLFQGVTTVVVGNDGFGSPDIARQADMVRESGIGSNVAFLAGFGPIRERELGKDNREPEAEELESMRSAMKLAMCEGAWGFSAGLYYAPQNYARTQEVVALAKVSAQYGGYYDTHMRDESTYNITVTGAVNEALEIGRKAEIPVHIAHVKALGPAVWGHSSRMIEAIEQARSEGLRVTADQYPWTASGTRISNALVPRWALAGGLEALRERLNDDNLTAKIREGMIAGLERRGGAERLLITGRLGAATVNLGETLEEVAARANLEPVDAAIAILRTGDARVASFNMNEQDIAAFATRPWVVTGSDGSTGHPRKYASFPKAYRDLVVEGGAMSMARFINRSSGQAADIIGLKDRGYLRPNYAADVVIFDPDEYAPAATYQSPRELSLGVRHLIINGEQVIADGNYTGVFAGRPLLKETQC